MEVGVSGLQKIRYQRLRVDFGLDLWKASITSLGYDSKFEMNLIAPLVAAGNTLASFDKGGD